MDTLKNNGILPLKSELGKYFVTENAKDNDVKIVVLGVSSTIERE